MRPEPHRLAQHEPAPPMARRVPRGQPISRQVAIQPQPQGAVRILRRAEGNLGRAIQMVEQRGAAGHGHIVNAVMGQHLGAERAAHGDRGAALGDGLEKAQASPGQLRDLVALRLGPEPEHHGGLVHLLDQSRHFAQIPGRLQPIGRRQHHPVAGLGDLAQIRDLAGGARQPAHQPQHGGREDQIAGILAGLAEKLCHRAGLIGAGQRIDRRDIGGLHRAFAF